MSTDSKSESQPNVTVFSYKYSKLTKKVGVTKEVGEGEAIKKNGGRDDICQLR